MSRIVLCRGADRKTFALDHVHTFHDLCLLVKSAAWRNPLGAFTLQYNDEDGDRITVAHDCDVPALKEVGALSSHGVQVRVEESGRSPASVPFRSGAVPMFCRAPGAVDLPCGTRFTHRLRVSNDSRVAWGDDVRLVHVAGERFCSFPSYMVGSLAPGEERVFSFSLVAPAYQGTFSAEWVLCVNGVAQKPRLTLTVRTVPQARPRVFPGLADGGVYAVFPGLRPLAGADVARPAADALPFAAKKMRALDGSARAAAPGEYVVEERTVTNSTGAPLSYGDVSLVHVHGERFGTFAVQRLAPFAVGESRSVQLNLRAPHAPGQYCGRWEVRAGDRVLERIEFRLAVGCDAARDTGFRALAEPTARSQPARAAPRNMSAFNALFVQDGADAEPDTASGCDDAAATSILSSFVRLF